MSEKELTYVLDEKPVEDDTIVGMVSIPWSMRHIARGCLPITAADVAKIERRAAEAETEAKRAELKVQLLAQLCSKMLEALREEHVNRGGSLNI